MTKIHTRYLQAVLGIRIWFNAHNESDPDPAFFVNVDPDSNPDSGVLMTKNWKTNSQQDFFLSNIATYLSLGLHKGYSSYRGSLHLSKDYILHLKTTLIFFTFVLWFILAFQDPDPYGTPNANPDPDPQHCLQVYYQTRTRTLLARPPCDRSLSRFRAAAADPADRTAAP